MKTLYSKEHYEKEFVRLSEKLPRAIHPVADLSRHMSCLNRDDFPESAWMILVRFYAEKVAKEIEEKLVGDKKTYIALRKGEVSLGYTTARQESHYVHEFLETFEFNCFALSEFKKTYCQQ